MKRSLIFLIIFVLAALINFKINAQQEVRWIGTTTQVLNFQGYKCLQSLNVGTKYLFWEARPYMSQNRSNQVANLVNSIKFNNHSNHLVWRYKDNQTVISFIQMYDKYFNSTIIDTLWLSTQHVSQNQCFSCDYLITTIYQCYARNQKCGYYFNETTYRSNILQNCEYMSNYPLLFQGNEKKFKPFNGWTTFKYSKDFQKSNLCKLNVGFSYYVYQNKLKSQTDKRVAKINSNNFQKIKTIQLQIEYIIIFNYSIKQINENRFKCLNFFNIGSKHILWTIYLFDEATYASLNSNIIKSKQTNHSNSIIYNYNPQSKDFLIDFEKKIDTYFNQTIVDTIWLVPIVYNQSFNCDIARAVLYKCIQKNRKCGFFFNQDAYIFLMKNQSCPQLSTFPLLYAGTKSNFTPFNGWNSFKYAYANKSYNICQLPFVYDQIVSSTKNQNQSYQKIYENFKRIQQSLSKKDEIKKSSLQQRQQASSIMIKVQ